MTPTPTTYEATFAEKSLNSNEKHISKDNTKANSSVSKFVSTFKRFCNKEIGDNIFQRGYIEHIVRDREDYETRAKYICENPIRWYYDE